MVKRRARGEGGISQRHDHPTCPPLIHGHRAGHRCQGRWVATLVVPAPGGRRRRVTLYGDNRKAVAIKLAQAKRDLEQHALVTDAPTVEAWLTYWLDVICVEQGRKTNTLRSHRSKVEQHLIPHLGHIRLNRLAPEDVRALYAAMRAQGLAEATVRQTHAILRRAVAIAVREQKVARNVADLVDPPSVVKGRREPMTLEDARTVLEIAGVRWYLALYLGLRQGEALALRWSDIDLHAGYLSITRGLVRKPGVGLVFEPPKSKASTRFVPLPPVVASRLSVAWAEHVTAGGTVDDLVFSRNGGPIHPRADWQEWRDLLRSAGVPHIAQHAARNTCASLLEAAGVPARMVAQILGQATVQVTYGYQHAELSQMADALLKLQNHVEVDA